MQEKTVDPVTPATGTFPERLAHRKEASEECWSIFLDTCRRMP